MIRAGRWLVVCILVLCFLISTNPFRLTLPSGALSNRLTSLSRSPVERVRSRNLFQLEASRSSNSKSKTKTKTKQSKKRPGSSSRTSSSSASGNSIINKSRQKRHLIVAARTRRLLQQTLKQVLTRGKFPLEHKPDRILLTGLGIDRIKLNSDFGYADIYFSPVGTAADRRRVFLWLIRNHKLIQHQMIQKLSYLRRCPKLRFYQVDRFEKEETLDYFLKLGKTPAVVPAGGMTSSRRRRMIAERAGITPETAAGGTATGTSKDSEMEEKDFEEISEEEFEEENQDNEEEEEVQEEEEGEYEDEESQEQSDEYANDENDSEYQDEYEEGTEENNEDGNSASDNEEAEGENEEAGDYEDEENDEYSEEGDSDYNEAEEEEEAETAEDG